MARKKITEQLTPLELEIMKVLWDGGEPRPQSRREPAHDGRKAGRVDATHRGEGG